MPLPSTMTPIATVILTATTTNIDFTSIPQNYTDLVLISSFKGTDANTGYNNWNLRINGDSSALYSYTYLRGDGTTSASSRSSGNTKIDFFAPRGNETAFNINIVHFQNYSNTSINKSILLRTNIPISSGFTETAIGLYRNTNAITSIGINGATAIGSTFTIYGIKAA